MKLVRISSVQDISVVQIAVHIDKTMIPKISVHNLPHDSLGKIHSLNCFRDMIHKLENMAICPGNQEDKFQSLFEYAGVPCMREEGGPAGFKEMDFGAVVDGVRVHSSVRSIGCDLLIEGGTIRCKSCKQYRLTLNGMLRRKEERTELNEEEVLSSRRPLKYMSQNEVKMKVSKLQGERRKLLTQNKSLAEKNMQLERKIRDRIRGNGEDISLQDHETFKALLEEARDTGQCSDYQHLLIEHQLHYNALTNKRSMRWHPTIIKWCLFLKSKSSKAYKVMRDSGFLNLPSERTLYDYSHYVKGSIHMFL